MKLMELLATGSMLSERTTPLYAEYNGSKQTVFAWEPGVTIQQKLLSRLCKKSITIMSEKRS